MDDSVEHPRPPKIQWIPPTKKNWNLADGQSMLAARQASGLSVCPFAKALGITRQRYYYWRDKVKSQTKARSSADTKTAPTKTATIREVKLVELDLRRREALDGLPSRSICVRVGKMRFDVDGQTDPQALSRLLRVILEFKASANA